MKIKLPKSHLITVGNAHSFYKWDKFINWPCEIETNREITLTEKVINDVKKKGLFRSLFKLIKAYYEA